MTVEVERIQDAVTKELGWAPIREVPDAFAAQVERAETAALEYHRNATLDALDDQTQIWEEIRGHPEFAASPLTFRLDTLNRIGLAGLVGFERSGREASLRSAESCWEQALALTPPSWPERARYLHNMGSLLLTRYRRSGDLEELRRALDLLREALHHPTVEDRLLPLFHSTLGEALKRRYERTGTLADLEVAIFHGEQALGLTSIDEPRRGTYLNSLGCSYRDRYIRVRAEQDIQRAVDLLEEAVRNATQVRDLRGRLSNLGNALLDRFTHLGTPSDLERAEDAHRHAVELTPKGDPNIAPRLNNLGNSLSQHFAKVMDIHLLDQAIDAYDQAVSLTTRSDPLRASRLYNLGRTLRTRHNLTGSSGDKRAAIRGFRAACKSGLEYSPEWALGASAAWGEWAVERHRWREAEEAYQFGIQATNRLYDAQLLAESRASWLREARGLTAGAAFVHARRGHLEEAVSMVELGRTRALNDALTLREALLEAISSPDRVALEAALRRVAELQAEIRIADSGGGRDFPAVVGDLHRAQKTLTERMDLIRAAHPDFMPRGLGFDAVAELVDAVKYPLVYLLTTPAGSLGLVVAPKQLRSASRVHSVRLGAFTSADLDTLLYDREGEPGYLHGVVDSPVEEFQRILDPVFSTLARDLMGPLASRLRNLGFRRALLIPTGALTILPLHAAAGGDVVFSFVPSARALKTVFHDEDHINASPRLLGVANPTSERQGGLAFTRLEVDLIGELFTRHRHSTTIAPEARATRTEIARRLPGATHLHFACHGRFDVDYPLSSALYFSGADTLTLQDLLDGSLDVSTARLAVLSACQTGLVDFLSVPDEVVGFPAGFIQAGVPGVVSTLWQIDDVSTSVLLARFYAKHLLEGVEPGAALNASQAWLRDSTAEEMELASHYERQYLASGRRDAYAFLGMRYYRANPRVKPFSHPYYWAAFEFTGI